MWLRLYMQSSSTQHAWGPMRSCLAVLLGLLGTTSGATQAKTPGPADLDTSRVFMRITEKDAPAILAFWQVKTLFSNPYTLAADIDRWEAATQKKPLHRFFATLKGLMGNATYKAEWQDCARMVPLSHDDAYKVMSSVVSEDAAESLADLLSELEAEARLLDIDLISRFEEIKRLSPNYYPALQLFARRRMAVVGASCPGLRPAIDALENAMLYSQEGIEEENRQLYEREESERAVERAPLVAVTVICACSIILNVVLGYYAAVGSAEPGIGRPSILYQQGMESRKQ